ncbi:hypothetical protein Tco_1117288 [Tanacetum coccineum]
MIEEATRSPRQRNQNLLLRRRIYLNLGCVKKRIRLLCGSATSSFPKGYECQVTSRHMKEPEIRKIISKISRPQLSKGEHSKAAKKGETSGKEKAPTIFMEQPWQRVTKQKITQSFSTNLEISFPPLENKERRDSLIVIEAGVGGHLIHRMYVDGGSAFEVLYEHCFNRLRPEIQNRMTPATTPLLGFRGEISWPVGKISLLVSLGDAKHSISD